MDADRLAEIKNQAFSCVRELVAEVERLQAENAKFREFVRTAQHDPICDVWLPLNEPCDCGLDELRELAGAEPEVTDGR